MLLHTLNASPASSAFADCLRLLRAGDAVLLGGDGVYAAIAGSEAYAQLLASGVELYLLDSDARAAGLPLQLDGATTVDMDGFVELTERFARQQAWF